MRVTDLACFTPEGELAVALGYFDGGHIGHQKILLAAKRAEKEGLASAVFSFPTLSTKSGLPLSTLDDRLAFFEENGIQNVILVSFDEIRALTAEDFVTRVLKDRLRARMAFCGFNYRFGRGAQGDTALLCRLLPESTVLSPTRYLGETVSSTRIREALTRGDVESARQMLGRPYALSGPVIHGDGRGHSLGFPTANIIPDTLLPRFGVYKTEVRFDGKVYTGLSDVGIRPTVKGSTARVETFLPDFSGDLYEKRITVSFLSFLREEKKFSSLDDLKAQILSDLKQL